MGNDDHNVTFFGRAAAMAYLSQMLYAHRGGALSPESSWLDRLVPPHASDATSRLASRLAGTRRGPVK